MICLCCRAKLYTKLHSYLFTYGPYERDDVASWVEPFHYDGSFSRVTVHGAETCSQIFNHLFFLRNLSQRSPYEIGSSCWTFKALLYSTFFNSDDKAVNPHSSSLFQLQVSLCPWRRWRTPCWRTFSKVTSAGSGPSSTPTTPLKYASDSRSPSWLTWWEHTYNHKHIDALLSSWGYLVS